MIEAEEQAFIEKLVRHPAVEALTEAVLHGLARSDEVPGDAVTMPFGWISWRRAASRAAYSSADSVRSKGGRADDAFRSAIWAIRFLEDMCGSIHNV
jgi:hypothetical protein